MLSRLLSTTLSSLAVVKRKNAHRVAIKATKREAFSNFLWP